MTGKSDEKGHCINGKVMFKNKSNSGCNVIGFKISELRKTLGISQRELADLMSAEGCMMHKNSIQRIESGKRFVTDIEIVYFCRIFQCSYETIFS